MATWPPSKPLSWVSRPLVLRSVVPSVAPASTSVASPPRFAFFFFLLDLILHFFFRLVPLRSNWLICCSIAIFFLLVLDFEVSGNIVGMVFNCN